MPIISIKVLNIFIVVLNSDYIHDNTLSILFKDLHHHFPCEEEKPVWPPAGVMSGGGECHSFIHFLPHIIYEVGCLHAIHSMIHIIFENG